jgi:two-component system response regulator HydG
MPDKLTAPAMVAVSAPMQALIGDLQRAAPLDMTVLVLGETGTGKEVLARTIHLQSRRAGGPFVPINCAALPAGTVDSELFGHKRGAFSGATLDRPGLFEEANQGTLFLDEVGELPLDTQARLLRALEYRQIRRVGENLERPIDVRLVAATNRDLNAMVKAGTFRQDLLFRLKVIALTMPPLRDRAQDMPQLARQLVVEIAASQRRECHLTDDAIEALLGHDWPGNVRELRNLLEQLVAFTSGEILDRTAVRAQLGRAAGGGTRATDGSSTETLTVISATGGTDRPIWTIGWWKFVPMEGSS